VYARVSSQIEWIQSYLDAWSLDPTVSPAPTPSPTPFDCDKSIFRVEIQSDAYPEDIVWGLYDMCDDKQLEFEYNPIGQPGGSWEKQYCINEYGRFNSTIFDLWGDGLCCSYGEGFYKFYLDGDLKAEGGEFDSIASYEWGNCDEPPAPECEDSPHKFKFEKADGSKSGWKKCEEMNPAWCDIGKNYLSCPKTCGACEMCEDSKLKFKTKDWNGQKKKNKCKDVNKEKKWLRWYCCNLSRNL